MISMQLIRNNEVYQGQYNTLTIYATPFKTVFFHGPLTRYVELGLSKHRDAGNVLPATDFKGNR